MFPDNAVVITTKLYNIPRKQDWQMFALSYTRNFRKKLNCSKDPEFNKYTSLFVTADAPLAFDSAPVLVKGGSMDQANI